MTFPGFPGVLPFFQVFQVEWEPCLEHGLAIITESSSSLYLNYTTSFVKVQIRSDAPSHTIPDTVFLPYVLNWVKLV